MASVSVQSADGISVGDKVQIKAGGMDVTNGLTARAGSMYGEGGPLWATVVGIYQNWPTGGLYGQPATVTKVRCAGNDGSTIVWQVQPKDIAGNVLTQEEPEEVEPEEPDPEYISYSAEDNGNGTDNTLNRTIISGTDSAYAIKKGSSEWWTGERSSVNNNIEKLPETESIKTKNIGTSDQHYSDYYGKTPSYKPTGVNVDGLSRSVYMDTSVKRAEFPTAWEDSSKRADMLNQNKSIIQNPYGYPYQTSAGSSTVSAKYDYQFRMNDSRYPNGPCADLESQLTAVRAAFGIPVHGNPQIAKSMKYYMYNRFKVPDTNAAFNKTFTHVFFTRPDLNILKSTSGGNVTISDQCMNHTEASMLWRRQPELFKLLVDGDNCGDSMSNFNLLLSNQVKTFDIEDEELATIESNASWDEHTILYGDIFKGREAGTFTCTFDETADLSIIQMMRLWITYIDNVRRGAWSPSYNLKGNNKNSFSASHVYSKTLDYAASAYMFKCGPDGEDVLYWTKFYGVFPTNTGASSLSWNNTDGGPDPMPQLSIRFAYSMKRDMSPISLIEFNHNARVSGAISYMPSFNGNTATVSRPFVGVPYIEMNLADPQLVTNDVNRTERGTQIRLKYKQDPYSGQNSSASRRDSILFKSNFG